MTLGEPAEVAGGGIAQLLGDRLHGAHPAFQQWQAHFNLQIIDKISKTTGQLTLERRLQGALISVGYQHNSQGVGNYLLSLDQGRHEHWAAAAISIRRYPFETVLTLFGRQKMK